MDWGEVRSPDNPMKAFFSLPQVLGHEVVADVVALGPEAEGLEVGDRVVLNPWLSCGPRGVSPICPACERGDYSLCASFADRARSRPGIHIGTSKDASGGYAAAHARARLDAVQGARRDPRRARGVRRPVRGDAARDHAPPTDARGPGKVMVYGAGALGTCATAILARALARRRRARRRPLRRAGRARPQARRDRHRSRAGAARRSRRPRRGRAACSRTATGCRWRSPAGSTSCTTRSGSRRPSRSAAASLKARGTHVKAGVHGPTFWEDTPLYFKEINFVGSNAFGFEEVDGVRKHGIDALPRSRARRPRRPHRDAHAHVPARRELARRVRRARDPGPVRRDQGGVRPALNAGRRRFRSVVA